MRIFFAKPLVVAFSWPLTLSWALVDRRVNHRKAKPTSDIVMSSSKITAITGVIPFMNIHLSGLYIYTLP
jgi:hypothetical protein